MDERKTQLLLSYHVMPPTYTLIYDILCTVIKPISHTYLPQTYLYMKEGAIYVARLQSIIFHMAKVV